MGVTKRLMTKPKGGDIMAGRYRLFEMNGVQGKTLRQVRIITEKFINGKNKKGWDFVSFIPERAVGTFILFRKR